MVKNLPIMQELQETRVRSLGWEDPLKKGMVTHSSIPAGKIPGQRSMVPYSPRAWMSPLDDRRLTEHSSYRLENDATVFSEGLPKWEIHS